MNSHPLLAISAMSLDNRFPKITHEKMDEKDLTDVLFMEAESSPNPWSKAMFIEEMQNPFAHCFITKRKETSQHLMVGFICFRNIEDESELFKICVHPQYRQLGIGKNMMQFYIDFCYKTEIKTFYLEVNVSNQTAVHLYQSFSYQPVGTRKKFYQSQFDALLMVKKV